MNGIAYLSSNGDMTSFTYGDTCVRFRTPVALEGYMRVKSWDAGYIVVDAMYAGHDAPVEEYIDLVPILQNLYMDTEVFLESIKEVCIA